MADYMTFADMIAEVNRAIKAFKGAKTDLVKHIINMVYLDELMVADSLYPLYWMVDFNDSLVSKAPATITGISATSPPVVSAIAHGFVSGDIVSLHNVVGMTEVNNRLFLVDDEAANNFELQDLGGTDIVGAGYTAWTSGGTVHHRGVSPTTSIQRILQAKWINEQKMTEITREELEESSSYWNDNTGRPQRYMLRKQYSSTGSETNQILWFPGADAAYKLRYWFEKRAAKLVQTTDVPLLPPQFHPAMPAGAIARLAENTVQVENAVIWPGIYRSHINSLIKFNRKFYQESDVFERKTPYLL